MAAWGDRMDTDASRRIGLMGARGAAVVLALVAMPAALAAPLQATSPQTLSPTAMDLWQRDKLAGDWGRADASKHGFDISLNYIGETLGILAGGFRRGADYEHRFELSIDTDLDKLLGWNGASAH